MFICSAEFIVGIGINLEQMLIEFGFEVFEKMAEEGVFFETIKELEEDFAEFKDSFFNEVFLREIRF